MFRLLAAIALLGTAIACRHAPATEPPRPQVMPWMPRYPDLQRGANVGGTVDVEVPVSADGRPQLGRARVLQASHEYFWLSARNALAAWRFTPARHGGQMAPGVVRLHFAFVIDTGSHCPPAKIRFGDVRDTLGVRRGQIAAFDSVALRGTISVCRTPVYTSH